ncbi:hypothetical protein Dalk_4612 [Desulfatibacillum aliphaticivorans]|uniref:Uncharacterized protein n=1 Tax=Desulfatibacillum aliphaticivorans TaxID=218208 RepID=B8FNK9_DESAL|nr:hypothetical protein [Desulfatibacillum aliphaticivorans]ACL06290.1 hypothetical protein Dalk_4612 [Desulfatibacillum aliphaticivorans]
MTEQPFRLKIYDGSVWPNPASDAFKDALWAARYGETTKSELLELATIAEAYRDLITHPAFTLAKVRQKVSWIRRMIKGDPAIREAS